MAIFGRTFGTKMEFHICLLILSLICIVAVGNKSLSRGNFPPSFIFGVGSSAYQYEGAAAEDGRKPCILDTYIHKFPGEVSDRSNATIADDQYHRYKEDVALLKDIGVDVYRFSISWSRIMPDGGLRGGVNSVGIAYYNNLINELISNGIKAIVTLFHWDLPQALEDQYQGFLSPKIIEDFRDYAELCFREFGDRVKIWATFNEPYMFVWQSYAEGRFPPARCSDRSICPEGDSATEPYIVGHHLILAHAAAAKLYKEKYQAMQKGQIGMSLNAIWMVPYSNSTKDENAASRALAFNFGWFLGPQYNGSYPIEMIERVGTRLPAFSKEESDMVKGSYDFVGLIYYTSRFAADAPCPTQNLSYSTDFCVNVTSKRNGTDIGYRPKDSWLNVYPDGLQQFLLFVKNNYVSIILMGPKIHRSLAHYYNGLK